MQIRIGLENGYENRSIAWVLDYPGCFAYGADGPEALVAVPPALLAYQDWIRARAPEPWIDLADFDIRLVEAWEVYCVDDACQRAPSGHEVNAWFQHDWLPLTRLETRRAALMLSWSRADLLSTAAELTPAQLDSEFSGERWSIHGVLAHVANAEWWYLDRLGLSGVTRAKLPQNVLERLRVTRERLNQVLPGLAGVEQVTGKQGELWSPRKLVRRALWHELDHLAHIRKLILRLQA